MGSSGLRIDAPAGKSRHSRNPPAKPSEPASRAELVTERRAGLADQLGGRGRGQPALQLESRGTAPEFRPQTPAATPTVGDTSTACGPQGPGRRPRPAAVAADASHSRPLPTGTPSRRAPNSRSPWRTRQPAGPRSPTRPVLRLVKPDVPVDLVAGTVHVAGRYEKRAEPDAGDGRRTAAGAAVDRTRDLGGGGEAAQVDFDTGQRHLGHADFVVGGRVDALLTPGPVGRRAVRPRESQRPHTH